MAPKQTKKSKGGSVNFGRPGKGKKVKKVTLLPQTSTSDASDISGEDSNEEPSISVAHGTEKKSPIVKSKKIQNQKAKALRKQDNADDRQGSVEQDIKPVNKKHIKQDDDDGDSDAERKPVSKQKSLKPNQVSAKKLVENMEESDDSEMDSEDECNSKKLSDDDDDDDDDASEDEDASEDDDDASEDEDNDASDVSDDDDNEDEQEINGKRKKTQKEKTSKKAKLVTSDETIVTLFVANLGHNTEGKKLLKLFKKNDIAVKDVRKMPQKPFGYVDLANADDFEAALALTGEKVEGQEIRVERAKEMKTANKGGSRNEEDSRTLFVKNLAESVTESTLRDVFDNIETIRMPTNQDGSHRGFAYMVFSEADQAATALEDKQGADLEGQSLFLDRPRQKGDNFRSPSMGNRRGDADRNRKKSTGERGTSKVLFVRNLAFQIDEDSLKHEFDNAASARIVTHADTGKPRGFGFVEFFNPEDAASAYDKMQGQEIMGREVYVDFAAQKSDGERKTFGGNRGRGSFRGGRGGFRGGRGRGGGGGGFGGQRSGKFGKKGSHKKFD